MAAMMFLSPNHFTTLFMREYGATPAAYLRRLRLERAQTLLRTSVSIQEITRRTGFRYVAQFSRAFHAVFNASPTAYRATFQPTLQPRKCPAPITHVPAME